MPCTLHSCDSTTHESFGCEQINHSPYSPDMAPSEFQLFLNMKRFFNGLRFDDDEEVKDAVTSRLTSQAPRFYNSSIQNLVSRYDKCLNMLVDYVEK
ncbi:hypothetical protein AVEN_224543-1 [Araneus ventricosus]|uniref:Histone-lysine N-methyltransferase SETMAR n=1 Tax=Araneus ventricosus TaxID=182803 RepID=A0A4Y2Q0D8_ARAVE|nr:hypothetical protein AVEN_224543-1 [Araneus ventricosus]